MPALDSGLSDVEEAKRIYEYRDGKIVRKISLGQRAKAGTEPGFINKGRRRVRFRGKCVEASHIIWMLVHGEKPVGFIDHINGNPLDNRKENLRDVDHSTNIENLRVARSDNRLGVLGVRKRPSGSYEARIWVKGAPLYLGSFPTVEIAHEAYLKAKRMLHRGCTI